MEEFEKPEQRTRDITCNQKEEEDVKTLPVDDTDF